MKNEIKFTIIGMVILLVGFLGYTFMNGNSGQKDDYTPVPVSERIQSKPLVQSSDPLFVPASNKHWGYTNGYWMELESDTWGNIMFGTMNSYKDVGIPQVGRRAYFITDSSFATVSLHAISKTIYIYVDGKLKVQNETSQDKSKIDIPVYKDLSGKHEIMVVWSDICDLIGITISRDATIYDYTNNRDKMVVIGNSYVAGSKDCVPGMTSFTALLNDKLGLEIVNQGYIDSDVDISYYGVGNSSGLDRLKLDVVYEKPKYVLVDYGIDAVKKINKGELEQQQYFDDYKRFIQQMREELPDATIFCSGIISIPAYSDKDLKPYNDGIRMVTESIDKAYFIDLSGCWNDTNYKTYVAADMLNPTEVGHKFLADKYTEFIKPYIDTKKINGTDPDNMN